MANNDIRTLAKESGVRMWQIADHLGVSEATVTRMLRKELPEAQKTLIFQTIEQIKKGAAAV